MGFNSAFKGLRWASVKDGDEFFFNYTPDRNEFKFNLLQHRDISCRYLFELLFVCKHFAEGSSQK